MVPKKTKEKGGKRRCRTKVRRSQRQQLKSQQLCEADARQSGTDTRYGKQTVVTAKINGVDLQVMIDTGATSNFISRRAIKKAGLRPGRKESVYRLNLIDGQKSRPNGGIINEEVLQVEMSISGHRENVSFDVFDMAGHDVVLGNAWFMYHLLTLDRETKNLTFRLCQYIGVLKP